MTVLSEQREPVSGAGHTLSVIIPALNEGSLINSTLDHLYSLPGSDTLETIVVDGSPGKETLHAILREDVQKISSARGRAHQMNAGASCAQGKVLVFLHADTYLPRDGLTAISSVIKRRGIIGGAFDLGIDSARPAFRLIESVASLRSRITRIPYGDQAIFMRRDYFHELGGFRELPLMEEVDLMRRVKRKGSAIYIIPEKVMTSPRRWESEGVLYCTLRNWTLITLYYLGVSPHILSRFYR